MIEIIDGVACLKGIKSPDESYDMFKWLAEHPEQELYIIEGKNKHGCYHSSGSLVSFSTMPKEWVKNGFCVNPFYKPLNDYANDFITATKEIPSGQETPICEFTESLRDYEKEIDELEQELDEQDIEIQRLKKELDDYVEKFAAEMKQHGEEMQRLKSELDCTDRAVIMLRKKGYKIKLEMTNEIE